MHEKAPILNVIPRPRLGSRHAARTRAAGQLPAILYGHKQDPVPLSVEAEAAVDHIKRGEKVFRLQMEGKKDLEMALLKDIQFDYLGTNIVHADFARVSLSDRVVVRVPVRLTGEAKGLKTAGAILMHPTAEIEIECTVSEIPESLEVEIAELDVGHGISAGDVKLPGAGMKLKTDVHAMVAQIVVQAEIKTEEAATVDAAAGTEPEVIREKKKDEEGADAAKPGAKDAKAAPAAKDAKPAAGGEKKKA